MKQVLADLSPTQSDLIILEKAWHIYYSRKHLCNLEASFNSYFRCIKEGVYVEVTKLQPSLFLNYPTPPGLSDLSPFLKIE